MHLDEAGQASSLWYRCEVRKAAQQPHIHEALNHDAGGTALLMEDAGDALLEVAIASRLLTARSSGVCSHSSWLAASRQVR
jgi:hypothetical protein